MDKNRIRSKTINQKIDEILIIDVSCKLKIVRQGKISPSANSAGIYLLV